MYFLTAQDPNYTVKGSRDPLGFQVIWQEAGRRLIPHLSTVSAAIKDFQILCLAYAIKKELKMGNAEFESFFIRFEQLMAYTRYKQNPGEGFNGVDKVRKIMSSNPATIKISHSIAEQILSNQRAYGIWGKYIRPFLDTGIIKTPEFEKIYNEKVEANPDFFHQVISLRKKTDSVAQINVNKLDAFFGLLEKPKSEERRLFIKYLLDDKCGNELLNLLAGKKNPVGLGFYELLKQLSASSNNSNFKAVLKYISNTEKVLSPLNHIFRHLQTSSFWKNDEIDNDEYISQWRTSPDLEGFGESSKFLAALLQLSNLELVKGLVKRNEEVSTRRRSAPWLRMTSSGFEVNHFEGGFSWDGYNPEEHSDNNYFLASFISLYNQLN